MALNGRAKGLSGENEFCEWLFLKGLVATMPKRNLNQVRSGGIDVVPDMHPFVYEVKRVELVTEKILDGWFIKASLDAKRYRGRDPIVAYRRNRGDWTFLVGVEPVLGVPGSYVIAKSTTFVKYAQKRIASYDEGS